LSFRLLPEENYVEFRSKISSDERRIFLSINSRNTSIHCLRPMEYKWRRHCVTVLGWEDPSGLDEDDKPLVQILSDGMRVATQAEVELNDGREGALILGCVNSC
jgi:hypothetical protein